MEEEGREGGREGGKGRREGREGRGWREIRFTHTRIRMHMHKQDHTRYDSPAESSRKQNFEARAAGRRASRAGGRLAGSVWVRRAVHRAFRSGRVERPDHRAGP